MKRLAARLSVLVLLGIPLALGAAVYLGFEDAASRAPRGRVRPEDVERACACSRSTIRDG